MPDMTHGIPPLLVTLSSSIFSVCDNGGDGPAVHRRLAVLSAVFVVRTENLLCARHGAAAHAGCNVCDPLFGRSDVQ